MTSAAFVEKDREIAQRVAKAWENNYANQPEGLPRINPEGGASVGSSRLTMPTGYP